MSGLKAVHFGAGNIGRGFIGKVLSEAGVEVVFADVVPALITELKKRREFKVRVVGENERCEMVRIKDAVFSNTDDVLDFMADADLITTAVGPRILELIAPTMAKGLRERMKQSQSRPVNIIACENAVQASSMLKQFVMKHMSDEEKAWADEHVGFVDCAVDRIVPPARHEDPLEVTVEEFCEWVVDKTQFKGPVPQLAELVYTDNLVAFVERKLLTVNTGHAICAYLGKLLGHKEIRTAIADSRVRSVVEGAMRESGAVLVKRYNMDPVAHENYIQKILVRYANPYIVDDVTRVGREPIRKLSPNDRLIKPLTDAIEYGLPHANLVKGVAAALLYTNPEDQQAVNLQKTVQALGWEGALSKISNLSPAHQERVAKQVSDAVSELAPPSSAGETLV
eukprot:Protomagalhaensia_wolfi_Nauph_80__6127@NODE_885_length_1910_cov_301_860502_g665_i0_p1_GENE_NODE_885_length_1910_cov_301_860502_g665_i0NODE_885_length_1910_cov_301_860502_g665_i0_p1_ORF_typecomplete_len396_score92_06Mannitol_dh_C/PF08125_13/3_2e43Mannitol_dh/PF01232_23/1_5e10F420_oxidored/PF03807_17/0_14F420_oxidored/PF03807_17/2_9e02UDPG_MGDP_dh_N/PF03721_14/0_0133HCDH_N/PF02737_18/0_04Sacchrp_dh_NADP/PF03435_18/0_095Sacchrp_dh_NADP/PF03435_18/3_1e03NAD_binding_2/PF03446_15/0_97NAD_binding_2/PF0